VSFDEINTVGVAIMLVPPLLLTAAEILAAIFRRLPRRTAPVLSQAEAPA
jgi:hypothetical protein